MTAPSPTGQSVVTTDGVLIYLNRDLVSTPQEVWNFLTDSKKLGAWYGTFTGDPATGEVRMSFVDNPDNPGRVRIDDCQPSQRLAVTLVDAPGSDWVLALSLEAAGAGTKLSFTHTLADAAGAGDIGPGWEYYLDRLTAALAGDDPGSVAWEEFHPSMVEHYSAPTA